MKKALRITAFIIAASLLTVALCSCGTENKLIGTWYLDDGDFMILNADKTCKVCSGGEIRVGTWEQGGKYINITVRQETSVFEIIDLTDNSLTVMRGKGRQFTFYKE